MISIRGGSGLGDAIYLQSVACAFIARGERVEVCSDWPDLFAPLGDWVKVSPFRRQPVDRNAHYSMRRGIAETSQFEDCCIQAGLGRNVEFALRWRVRNLGALDRLPNPHGLPAVVVSMPRAPFGRDDGFGVEFLPNCHRIQQSINMLRGRALTVQVGKGEAAFEFKGIDLDLANETSVSDLLDVATLADGFLGFCSYIVPLAEAQSKPGLFVWSSRGLHSPHLVVRQMTPEKILHRKSSAYAVDDCDEETLKAAVDAFYLQVRRPALV